MINISLTYIVANLMILSLAFFGGFHSFPFIFFSCILIWSFYRNRKVGPSEFILFIYAAVFGVALFAKDRYLYDLKMNHSAWSTFAMTFFIFILLIPGMYIKRPNMGMILRSRFFYYFVRLSVPVIIFSFIYLFPYAIRSLASGALEVRTSLSSEIILPASILTTIAVGTSLFYPLYTIMFFYARILHLSLFLQLSMLLGSALGVLGGLVYASRDRLIWIPLFFIFSIWLWNEHISNKDIKVFKFFGAIIGLICLYILVIFTVDRFSGSSYGFLGSIFMYFGAQPYVFAETLAEQTVPLGIGLRFPIIADLLGIRVDVIRDTPYQWMFGTLVADFYAMGGWLSLIFFSFGFSVFFFIVFTIKRLDPVASLLLLILYCQVIVQGVFYFSLGFEGGNYYLIAILIFALVGRLLGYRRHAK